MPSKYLAILFDVGNTLIYPRVEELAEDLTKQGYAATVEDFFAAERAGKQKLDEWLWPQIRQGSVPRTIDHYYWFEYLKALMLRVGAPEPEHERLMRHVRKGFGDITLWSRVLPETPPFLAKLRAQGYYLGVISNSSGTIEQQLGRVNLAHYFNAIFDSALVGVEKPHPEIFRVALERAGMKAGETVFVGDTNATDMGGAYLAGLRGVLIDRVGAYPHVECPCIASLPDLEPLLAA
ncbi:MAG: HAD family hydrolase [Terriglobia bacterium]|jgi:putative hydrolase of the HAD superfamily